MNTARRLLLHSLDASYRLLCRPLLFRMSAQRAHSRAMTLLGALDGLPPALVLARQLRRAVSKDRRLEVGGLLLSQRLILAAGLVKGRGFASEDEALQAAAAARRDFLPGWRIMPALVGPVEFGSFTRHPRLGNPGTVVWRDTASQSTQNRMGLRNPGARAAAAFLGARLSQLPAQFGINIAVSPGVTDPAQQQREALEALAFFLDAGVKPQWFTLNISCPNTEDDPRGHQLEAAAHDLCGGFIAALQQRDLDIPLWVKVSPDLADAQYHTLMRVFAQIGVRAVLATNTLALPSPSDATETAGLGGGDLRTAALHAVEQLTLARDRLACAVDIIACGGILDGASWQQYQSLGCQAAQYWSALVYRGPFAAALIVNEANSHERRTETIHRERLA